MHMTFPLKQNYKYLILKAQILKKVNDLRLKKKNPHTWDSILWKKELQNTWHFALTYSTDLAIKVFKDKFRASMS